MKRYSTTGPSVILAVPTVTGDPEKGIPTTVRYQGYSQAQNSDGIQAYGGIAETDFVLPSSTITVSAAAFPSFDTLFLGEYILQESIHFEGVDGDTAATAAALALAISGLPGWSATADGDDVIVTALRSILGEIPFAIRNRKDPANFTLSTDTGYIAGQTLFSPVVLL